MIEGMLLDLMMRGPALPLFAGAAGWLYLRAQRPAAPLVVAAVGIHLCTLAAFYGLLAFGGALTTSGLAFVGTVAMRALDQGGAFACFGLVLYAITTLPGDEADACEEPSQPDDRPA
jgi:hypothetical protein